MSERHPEIVIESLAQWRDWLTANHASAPGVWVTTYKKNSGRPHVPVDEIVDEAIAHGWIDSRPRVLDGARSQRLLTPRRPTSASSRVNKQRVERLIAAGRMAPAGLAAVETAKQNGSWTALDEVETLTEPDDLQAALDANRAARRYWDAFPRSTKRAILDGSPAPRPPAHGRGASRRPPPKPPSTYARTNGANPRTANHRTDPPTSSTEPGRTSGSRGEAAWRGRRVRTGKGGPPAETHRPGVVAAESSVGVPSWTQVGHAFS